jgi:hypothetical protein
VTVPKSVSAGLESEPEPALEEEPPPHDISNSAAVISKILAIIKSHLFCNNTEI